eukprot:CAMPEP_0174912350 /NCGR_PEP_ID=MMETSP0167-20121228/79736_1 /TAXON_ID=38298 /ORGANISM="Rhodella maculata, Strain CCMP736" /LENGTH=181 /DNA_ID=CAMNT_0016156995 /DNA_START=836 /DNA_END=1379 /DNA_ORIENTATION=-
MDGGEEGGRAKEGGDGGEPGLKLVKRGPSFVPLLLRGRIALKLCARDDVGSGGVECGGGGVDGGEEGGRAKEGGDGGETGLKLVALGDEAEFLSLNFSAKGFHDALILLILREVLRLHRVVELPPQPPILHVRPGRREPRLCDFLAQQSSQPARELHSEDLKTLCLRHRLRGRKAACSSTA